MLSATSIYGSPALHLSRDTKGSSSGTSSPPLGGTSKAKQLGFAKLEAQSRQDGAGIIKEDC